MLADLGQWRSCRLKGSLASEGATLWRFEIFMFRYDEAEALLRLLDSFTRYDTMVDARWVSVVARLVPSLQSNSLAKREC